MTVDGRLDARPLRRILVIKLGALGDVVQATGPFAAIRAAHPDAHLTLLTTKPYAAWLATAPWFDAVWIDERPRAAQILAWGRLRRRLREGRFDRVYDLQTSSRSSRYFHLMAPGRPEWSGIARGCSHPDPDPRRDFIHTLDRQRGQLRAAGVTGLDPDLSWSDADLSGLDAPAPFALLVPGGAAHRPEKRWPAERFVAVAQALLAQGVTPLWIGSGSEADLTAALAAATPGSKDLAGRTGFAELAALARRAVAAIGNDTGPMHLFAAAGCRALAVFGPASDPALCAPRGPAACWLRADPIGAVTAQAALAALGFDG